MAWKIELGAAPEKFLEKLDPQTARRLYRFLKEKLAYLEDPRSIGEAFKGKELGNYWKYRVGEWRIVASIEDTAIRISVIRIGHRRDVYR